jgi:ribosomal protein L29
METQNNAFSDFLRKSADKLEELQAQVAQGKTDFSERFEEVKKDTLAHINKVKADANALADKSKEKLEDLRSKMQHLEVQLALGKAETKEELEKQRKNIADAIHKLKHALGV